MEKSHRQAQNLLKKNLTEKEVQKQIYCLSEHRRTSFEILKSRLCWQMWLTAAVKYINPGSHNLHAKSGLITWQCCDAVQSQNDQLSVCLSFLLCTMRKLLPKLLVLESIFKCKCRDLQIISAQQVKPHSIFAGFLLTARIYVFHLQKLTQMKIMLMAQELFFPVVGFHLL